MKNKLLILIAALLIGQSMAAQEEKPELSMNLQYHSLNNKIPYLIISTKIRTDKAFETVKGAGVNIYMNEESESGLIGKVVTNDKGIAKLVIPASSKLIWDSSIKHSFIAVSDETKQYAETRTEIEIATTKIIIDTTLTEESKRAISVQLSEFDGSNWVAAADVELKIGVRRLGSLLPISEEESYTTDSTGMVIAAFERDSLPVTDKSGNLVLAVKVEDNDSYGNLMVEKTVPWGIVYTSKNNFNERSLWATRDKAPLWLLFMAYAIIIAVWGVIVYLVLQLIKVKKLGTSVTTTLITPNKPEPAPAEIM